MGSAGAALGAVAATLILRPEGVGSLDRLSALGMTTKLPGVPALVVLLIWVLTGGLGEETGWRSWSMPMLTTRFGFVRAALMVAAVWMTWHAPQFLFNPGFRGMGWATIGGRSR